MHEFFSRQFFGNSLRDYTILVAVLLIIWAVRRPVSRALATLFFSVIKKWATLIHRKDLVDLLLRPIEFFLLLSVFMLTVNHFHFPEEFNFVLYRGEGEAGEQHIFTLQQFLTLVFNIAFASAVIWIALRIVDFVSLVLHTKSRTTQDKTDDQFIIFFKDFFKAILTVLGCIWMIRLLFGPSLVEKLVAGLGIGAAALALAAKESIENLIGSFIIFSDKPFHVGDSVKVNGYQGEVEKIGLRSTRIRTVDKTFVTVPNKQMVDSIVDNLTLRTQRRVELRLELDSDTPADKILAVIKRIRGFLVTDARVNEGFQVNLQEFSKDTYVIQVVYLTMILEAAPFLALREEVNIQIIRALEKESVKLPATKTIVIDPGSHRPA